MLRMVTRPSRTSSADTSSQHTDDIESPSKDAPQLSSISTNTSCVRKVNAREAYKYSCVVR